MTKRPRDIAGIARDHMASKLKRSTSPDPFAPKADPILASIERLATAKTNHDKFMSLYFGNDNPTLIGADGSKLHKFMDRYYDEPGFSERYRSGEMRYMLAEDIMATGQVYLIQHDWAAVIADEVDRTNIVLPYRHCIFEYNYKSDTVGSVRVMALVEEHFVDAGILLLGVYSEKINRVDIVNVNLSKIRSPFLVGLANNISAACVMMESEVADGVIVRTPNKLNKARECRGKDPINDYWVLDISKRRKKYQPLEPEFKSDQKRKSPRLHFRSGHWRHYPNHSTRIKWMLVGNPDLGFIEKVYSL